MQNVAHFIVPILCTVITTLSAPALTAQSPCSLEDCTIQGFGADQRVIWIPGLPGPVNHRFFFEEGDGHFETYSDGTAHIYGQTFNQDAPDYKLYIDIWFAERADWTTWESLGRGWKGEPANVGDLYTTWDYYIMHPDSANRLEATGAWDGVLNVTHRPESYYYGFQVGEAANDQNSEVGMSVWMDYTGNIDGDWLYGNADINAEGGCEPLPLLECAVDVTLECGESTDPSNAGTPVVLCDAMELSYSDETSGDCPITITRTWTVTAASGEVADCVQTITVADTTAPVFGNLPALEGVDCESPDLDALPTATDACSGEAEVTSTVMVLDYAEAMCGAFRTQTPGGWGAPASGNNPGAYRDAHFAEAFPDGLTIGCTNTLTLTSAAAVEAFLPAGGTPAALPPGQAIDPTNYSNSLAQHLVAIKLSLGFDALDVSFGEAYGSLADLVLNSSAMSGLTVEELVAHADAVIGGSSTEFSASDLTDGLSTINENFVDGTTNNGDLDCPEEGICGDLVVVTYEATDACGNVATATQLLELPDTTAPVILTEIADATVSCDGIPEPYIEVSDCGAGEVTWEVETLNFSGGCLPTIQYVYTASDACGNTATASQFLVVLDSEAPSILNAPDDLILNCGDPIAEFTPEAIDNCDQELEVELSESSEPLSCGELLTQTWTVMDECGNTDSVSRTVTITDNLGPALVAELEDLQISCDQGLTPEAPAFVDTCGDVASVEVEVTEGVEGCSSTALYTWTATDNCGNQTVVIQNVTILDDTPPVFVGLEALVTLQCGDAIPAADATAIDDCSEATVNSTDEALLGEGCGGIVRTYTATDACGNASTFVQTLVLLDDEAPVLSEMPADFEGSCGSNPSVPSITASDNCSSSIEVSFDEQQEVLPCGLQITRTWSAMDDCENSVSHTQVITLTDLQAPLFSGDVLVTTSCLSDPMSFISVTDDCDADVQLTVEEEVSGDVCNQVRVRTFTATDNCGNTSTFEQTLLINDNQPPVFIYVPEDEALACGDEIPAVSNPIVEDACSAVMVTLEESNEGTGCGHLIRRIWTATDGCGNSSSAEQVLYVGDNVAPVFVSVPEDLALDCGDALPEPGTPVVEDDCGEVSLSYNENMVFGNCTGNYELQRIWTAEDACGNMAYATQSIVVSDVDAPVFDVQLSDIVAQCGQVPPPAEVSATDACGTVLIDFTETFESGGCPNIIRTWTATDDCGNSSILVQSVLVEDNEPPVLEGVITIVNTDCNNIPEVPEPEVSDNCDDDVAVTYTENIMGTGCEFTIVRTWIASDDCGNTTILSQSVNVQDTEAPVFVEAPAEMTLDCGDLESVPFPNVLDDCGATVNMTFVDSPSGTGCNYDIERVWTAQDACGNQATATQVLHVVDQTPPVLSGIPANSSASCDAIPAPVMPLAQDACSEVVSIDFVEVQLGEGCSYTLQRTWTAADACGNAISIARLVFVEDTAAPVFLNVPQDVTDACAGGIAPEIVHPEVVDACGATAEVQFVEFVEALDCGQLITRSWVATDACGNTASAQQLITLSDTEPPVLAGIPDPIQVGCDAIPAPAVVTAEDACGNGAQLLFEEVVEGGGCPYILRRTWTAVDNCGNMAIASQEIEVIDEIAPVLVGAPEDITVACGMVPEAELLEAVDNCSGVAVMLSEEWVSTGCVSVLARTWTATDLCGNSDSYTQHIEVVDQSPPTFSQVPENQVIFCGDPDVLAEVEMVDDCAGGILQFEETTLQTECASEYSMLRTWTATDVCGNTSMITQIVEVVDVFAPVWPEAPADITVGCEDIPELPELTFTGECDDNVVVTIEETIVELDVASEGDCTLGNAETDWSTVALWLPNLDGYGAEYVFVENGGTFTQDFEAGTAHVSGQVYDPLMPGNSWMVDLFLENKKDWSAWSEGGGSYKDDFGFAGDLYQTWDYYTLSSASQLVGADHLEGSLLNLTHAPADFSFGFQVGEAANNRNAEYGMSGWFFYTGFVQGVPTVGIGDLMTENACCSDHDIIRTWTLTDCAGNVRVYSQTIQVRQDISVEPLLMLASDDEDEGVLDVWGSEGEVFRIAFTPEASGDFTLTICNDLGVCVASQELRNLKAGERVVVAQSKRTLTAGVYVFTVLGANSKHTDREIVLR